MVMGAPDMNLMDDFEEMEKLAIVSGDFPGGSSHHSSEQGNGRIFGPSGSPPGSPKPKPGIEMVPVRIDDLLKLILQHCQQLQKNPHQVLEDMKVALEHNTSDTAIFKGKTSTNHPDASDSPQVGFQTSPNKSFISDASDTGNDDNVSTAKKIDQNVSASMHKILELLEEINMKSEDNHVSESSRNKNSATPAEYICRVFQWKTAQFSSVLQQLLETCNDLQNGTADVGQFIRLVASTLDWVTNHCFSLQDVSSMKNAVRTHLDWDESRSESEVDSRSANQYSEPSRQREDMSYLPLNGEHSSFDTEPNAKEEAERLNIQPEKTQCSVMDSEDGLQPQIVESEGFMDIIDNLQSEMEAMTMKRSKGNTGDQIEKQEITETNLEWSNDLENDLENNKDNSSIKRQEGTSNDLKILLKSETSKGVTDDGKPWEKQLRNDWEITTASEKLAECQETILNLGKQLKALASPRKTALFDKVKSTQADSVVTSISISTCERNVSWRLSLLDNMLAEDNN
ncbi:hypothetical protein CDL12_28242 [Handroanthus impetiginosus]|uniref:Uncharacterized protein n=1 Tax=Handroanthus impetiginosus TaxID=429701 RepID=A0A2G9G1V3_9LAMI|nr:hypothetical protein CDL12_28242 [Handroanthus impetiginosus]